MCADLVAELPRLRRHEALKPWLMRVTRHKTLHWKTQVRRESLWAQAADASDALAMADGAGAKLLEDVQREQALREAIASLPPRCREMVRLLFYEQPPLPYNEVARRLGLATGSIGFIRGRCLRSWARLKPRGSDQRENLTYFVTGEAVLNATPDDGIPIDERLPLLFYCHDALRCGSARRAALVASLSSRFRVVLVGGPEALERIDAPPSVEVVRLPSLGSADASPARAHVLLGAYLQVDPAVLLIEQFPFGCAPLADDIVTVLEGAAVNPRTRLVACSIVDFLADQSVPAQRRDVQAQRLANWYFDVVFVHADPRVGRCAAALEPQTLRVPVRYTGFVAPMPSDAPVAMASQRYEIVVTGDGARPDPTLFRAAQRPPPPYFKLDRSGAAETLRIVARLADPPRMFPPPFPGLDDASSSTALL